MNLSERGAPDAGPPAAIGGRGRFRRFRAGEGVAHRRLKAPAALVAYAAVAGLMRDIAEEGPWPGVGRPAAAPKRRRRAVALVP